MELEYTHILVVRKSQVLQTLFRASDGMLLGECQKEVCVFGENPARRESRVFVDHEHAANYLTQVVAKMGCDHPVFDVREAESLIELPPNSVEMFQPGISNPMRKSRLRN